jgi:hypothetical protein
VVGRIEPVSASVHLLVSWTQKKDQVLEAWAPKKKEKKEEEEPL